MSWKYQPSETVWALVSDADTLYGGNVWFQTVERGDDIPVAVTYPAANRHVPTQYLVGGGRE